MAVAGAVLIQLFALLLALPLARAAAQPVSRCDPRWRVRELRIAGSPLYDAATLALSISTTAPTFAARVLHLGRLPCADSLEVQRDAVRLAVLHRQAGWIDATVTPTTATSSDGVRIRFDIVPGTPAIVDSLITTGLPDSGAGRRPFDAALRALIGQRFDRVRLDTTITETVTRLRDAGYARAGRPTIAVRTDTAASRVRVDLRFVTGPVTTIRTVTTVVQGIGGAPPTVDTAAVRRLTALKGNTRFRAADLLTAQRDLYRADAFRLVLLDTVTPPSPSADSLIDLRISVAEARSRNARVGVGWATLECLRTQARLVDRRFLGVGRRLELTARASRIGVGAPADFAPSLCSRALRADTQFTVLNHYFGATVASTRLFGSPLSPITTVYTERRSEPYAYVREIGIGALIELSRQVSRRTALTYGLQYENGRTKIDPAESCARFGQCRQEDYTQSVFGRGVGIASTTVTHDRTNNPLDPARGYRVRGEGRMGQTYSRIDSSVLFFRTSGDIAGYRRMLGGVVAARFQLARAFAPRARIVDGSPLIPQQERLFGGGQGTVRGYQQNLLGPLVYVVSAVDSAVNNGVPVLEARGDATARPVPRGGTAMMIANLEYRHGFRWLAEQMQFVSFVDMGNVWEGGSQPFKLGDLRATPGVGIRVLTTLGPFRMDIGYSPYEPRAGRALYLSRVVGGVGGTIRCASPGNSVSIDPQTPGSIFDCPATYRPPRGTGVLSRLAFHFGLGQAF